MSLYQDGNEYIDEMFAGNCEGDYNHYDDEVNEDTDGISNWNTSDGEHSTDKINLVIVAEDELHDLQANFANSGFRHVRNVCEPQSELKQVMKLCILDAKTVFAA